MAYPKKKVNISVTEEGKVRQQELIDMTNDKSTFLPKSILLRDLDGGMMDFVSKSHLKVNTHNGQEIPVFFLTKERWAEFSMTWKYADKDGNIVMPFITLRRSDAPKPGTNQNIKYRIAQNKKFDYVKIPTFDNGVHGVDIYKIPQPVPVDLTFETRIFTHFQKDLNSLNEIVQKQFASGEAYTNIKGYFIPIKLDGVTDESTMNDYEGKRFYSQTFTFIIQGFLQDEKDFEVEKGVRRAVLNLKENTKNE